MNDLRKAAEMALAKLEHLWDIGIDAEYKVELLPEIEALRQALAQPEQDPINKMPTKIFGPNLEKILNAAGFYRQPEQEPVAWMVLTQDDKKLMLYGEEKPPIFDAPVKLIPLYTAPPSKPWVSLTDEEKCTFVSLLNDKTVNEVFNAIEAVLKERNND